MHSNPENLSLDVLESLSCRAVICRSVHNHCSAPSHHIPTVCWQCTMQGFPTYKTGYIS